MHAMTTQALAAERVREWHDRAAQDRLVHEARRARRDAASAAAGPRRRRPGFRWPARRPAVPVDLADEQPAAAVAGEQPAREPVGSRAA